MNAQETDKLIPVFIKASILIYSTPSSLPKAMIVKMTVPSFGTEDAVGGAASTRMSSNTRKLENRLIAGMS